MRIAPPRHNDYDDPDHVHDGPLDPATAKLTWALEHVQLTTVGIDIGSATVSVMFARLVLERKAQELSSRFEVVDRSALYRSPISFTPYMDDGDLIDAEQIRGIVDAAYAESGLSEEEIDTGVVLLTGVALLRHNARAIGELLADEGGKFVCAAAGHNLEALLAAHGAGGVTRSGVEQLRLVSLDVGGGTTKLTLIQNGTPVATAATPGGGRLLAWDAGRQLIRVEPSVVPVAAAAGFTPRLGEVITEEQSRAVAELLAARAVAAVSGRLEGSSLLAGGLPAGAGPDLVLLSGGVAQHLIPEVEDSPAPVNDLGRELAHVLDAALRAAGLQVEVASNPISATVIGASQFSAQVSGNTVAITQPDALPVHNLPVVMVDLRGASCVEAQHVHETAEASRTRLSLENATAVVYGVRWGAQPDHANLRALADGILASHQRHADHDAPLFLCIDADIAANLGAVMTEELDMTNSLIVLDGLELGELDYLDVGEVIRPTNVVPALVKSLLFANGARHHAR